MSGVLLDTHVLVWLMEDTPELGIGAKAAADAALAGDGVFVSAITFWEVAMLQAKGRLVLSGPVVAWRRAVLDLGINEIAIGGDISITSVYLEGLHGDPADRMIAATALVHGLSLLTADQRLFAWRGDVLMIDARR